MQMVFSDRYMQTGGAVCLAGDAGLFGGYVLFVKRVSYHGQSDEKNDPIRE